MKSKHQEYIKNEFIKLSKYLLENDFTLTEIQNEIYQINIKAGKDSYKKCMIYLSVTILIGCLLYQNGLFDCMINYLIGIRCLVPNNYIIWEGTRPLSDCKYCINTVEPILLENLTKEEFANYAYTSKPVVIKGAFLNWPAIKYFDFNYFKYLYQSIEGSYESVDEECQFLHFQSDFISIKNVFEMSDARARNDPGEKPWYVGWGNCHSQILEEMRHYYPKPHFLPDDCEMPSKEYVFMGYNAGATMHLDFINRLMWQAQLRGTKTWFLVPSPECENICQPFQFVVEPGDAVLVDTRIWYHGTEIKPGEFSLSIQSEYG